ncbi:MAG TPA: glycosyltransferase family A protein [Casimicrobiaceae bacterium]|nr:glycosyltransferase family A protein [Casimicrobiaceae bacterium]
MSSSSILAVVPTFNRGELVELTARYLRRIDFAASRFSFLISDDCSTEYGLAFLKGAYAGLPGVTFMRTSRNCGPIAHTWVLLKHFAASGFDKVLVLDSDLLVHERCLRYAADFEVESISSLYNSCLHGVQARFETYCTKADIGWAGALVARGIVEELLAAYGSQPFDDWALSELAQRRGLAIKVASPSALQHIGIFGSNNAGPEGFDRALDFPADDIDQSTRDYFVRRHGLDLMRWLSAPPDPEADLSRFALPGSSTPSQ